jgi:hypothetical protein
MGKQFLLKINGWVTQVFAAMGSKSDSSLRGIGQLTALKILQKNP